MADDIDFAADLTERERQYCVSCARRIKAKSPGPYICMCCGEINDRREQGYAICIDCWEGYSRDNA